jgi:hypothetical protein
MVSFGAIVRIKSDNITTIFGTYKRMRVSSGRDSNWSKSKRGQLEQEKSLFLHCHMVVLAVSEKLVGEGKIARTKHEQSRAGKKRN